jgi:hypothetical protein
MIDAATELEAAADDLEKTRASLIATANEAARQRRTATFATAQNAANVFESDCRSQADGVALCVAKLRDRAKALRAVERGAV